LTAKIYKLKKNDLYFDLNCLIYLNIIKKINRSLILVFMI